MSNKQLIAQTGEYLTNLDAVSKLTGKTKESLQAEEKARQTDSQFRVIQAKVGKEGAGRLNALMNTMGPGMQKAFQAYAASGAAMNDQAKSLTVTNPAAAAAMVKFHKQMEQSGTVTEEMMYELDEALRQSSKAAVQSATTQTMATFQAEKHGQVIVDQMDLAGQEGNLRKIRMQQQKDEAAARERAEKGIVDALDPAALQASQQRIAIESNKFSELLAARMPELEKAFTKLVEYINGPLMKAFNFMMDNLGKIAIAVGAFTVLLTGIKALFKGKELFDKVFGGRGSPGNPMHVTMDGGGGLGGGGGGKRQRSKLKKTGLSAKTAGRLVKGTALVGAALSAYDAYDTFQDVDEQVAEGKMSKDEGKKAKVVAGSKAAGTAAGGYGGAMAGAAIGTMVFPGVGTVIGGAIGGALGAWGGEAAAGATAEALTADQSKSKSLVLTGDSLQKAKDWAWSIYSGKNDISQVPIGLRGEVGKILKSPPGSWAAEMAKRSSPVAAIPSPPKVADFAITQKEMVAAAAQTKAASATDNLPDQMKASAKDLLSTGVSEIKSSKPLTSQESPESLLASLNTKMEAMLKLNSRFVELASRQLSVQQGLSGNLLKSV
jgi:hypothetical protein